MLSARNLHYSYNSHPVLRGIDLEVDAGQFVGIIGPNGSGKTTLLRALGGVIRPARGDIYFEGSLLSQVSRVALAKRLACLTQTVNVNLPFTVQQVVLLGRNPHLKRFQRIGPSDQQIAANAMADAAVSDLADKLITEISAGERQRVFIAMALAQQPDLLMLDEPTSHLDIAHQVRIYELLSRLHRDRQLTVVIVSHDLNLAAEYCQKLILLDNGQVACAGPVCDVICKETLEQVYGTEVTVQTNRSTGRPHVMLGKHSYRHAIS
jgi:iron complex transport system ATP-binding protein